MSVVKRTYAKWLVVPAMAAMLLTGCKDDDDDDDVLGPDAGDAGGTNRPDGGMDGSTPSGDAGWDDLTVIPAAISATGHDRFYGVAYDAQGNIFAVGQTSEGVTPADDSSIVLAKFTKAGVLDTTFGAGKGYIVQNVTVGGQNVEAARGIVIQTTGANAGRIVVAGDADHAALPADAGTLSRDTDIVLVRFLPTGEIDPTFGTAGTARLDLGAAVEVTSTLADGGVQQSLSGADTAWSLSQAADGKLVIHGATRAVGVAADGGVRADNDYTLIRLTENGLLDTTFATTGFVRTDVGQVNGSARSATVLPDNSIVAAGYTTSTVLGSNTQQPVLYKVKADGTPDTSFAAGAGNDQLATPGLWHGFARNDSARAEAYGATPQGNKFVTLGYGPTPNTTGSGTDWVFFRFNADGSQDKSFGTNGETFLDPARFSDNGRALTTLPDDRIIGVGGGRPEQAPAAAGAQPTNVDGMIGVLTPTGQPDPTFGTGGFRLIDWGNADFLHACAVAPAGSKQVAIVGAAGGGREATADDDAVLLLWTMP